MAKEEKSQLQDIDLDRSKYEFRDEDVSIYKTPKGINEDIVREISAQKNEPGWMLEYRLKSLEEFNKHHQPSFLKYPVVLGKTGTYNFSLYVVLYLFPVFGVPNASENQKSY